jgi:SPP1 gp7 family putative phage head morphogenesis protein
MPKKIISPIIYKDMWHNDLAKKLISILFKAIFEPILETLEEADIKANSKVSALEKALRKGTIQFRGGSFKGSINSAISKEIRSLGGKFINGSWKLPSPSLPSNLQKAIYANKIAMDVLDLKFSEITAAMPTTVFNMITDMSIQGLGLEGVNRVSREFKKTVGKAYAVMPDIKKEGREELLETYFDTDELPIKLDKELRYFDERTKEYTIDFAHEEVAKLRREVSQLIANGRSRNEVRNLVQNRLQISYDRCKFIARQETSLLTSKFKQIQYKQAGIDKYIWRTVGDNRVRDKHDELNGKEFSFSNPPNASYFNTGEPCNPSEDYNCRCVALPVIEW